MEFTECLHIICGPDPAKKAVEASPTGGQGGTLRGGGRVVLGQTRGMSAPLELPSEWDADAFMDAFESWVRGRGIRLYPAQEEAVLELVLGRHLVLSTPTGTGKSLVAVAAHAIALAQGGRSLLHRADQGAGEREVLRAGRDLRRRLGRHGHRRLQREPGRARSSAAPPRSSRTSRCDPERTPRSTSS